MDVAVIGAGGAVGRQIVTALVDERAMPTTSRLQLVARRGGPSERICLGLAVDVRDADIETAPTLEVVAEPDAVDAQIVIVVAGATIATDPRSTGTRADLARANLPVFRTYAEALARSLRPDAVVVVVSNPVELGVRVLADTLGAHRVFGMGAHLDSLRFRRELAHDLGLPRQQVQGLVLGEHGANQVPCWSTVQVWGAPAGTPISTGAARALEDPAAPSLGEALAEMRRLLADDRPYDAFAYVESLPPDRCAGVKPFFAQYTGAKTAMGTARAAVDLVDGLLRGHVVVTGGQREVTADDDSRALAGLVGCTGVPLRISAGRADVSPVALADDEVAALHAAARRFEELSADVGVR